MCELYHCLVEQVTIVEQRMPCFTAQIQELFINHCTTSVSFAAM
jgi:hypothetical protein